MRLHLLWGDVLGHLLEQDLEASHGEFQTQRPRDLGAANCGLLLPPCVLFSSSLSFRAQLGLPLLQEALPDASSPSWLLPFLTLSGAVWGGGWSMDLSGRSLGFRPALPSELCDPKQLA